VKIGYGLVTRGIKERDRSEKERRRVLSTAVRDGLRLMEEEHKKRQILRGRGRRGAVMRSGRGSVSMQRWSWRTGNLARSYRIHWKRGDMVGYYGSNVKYAAIHERGGTIRAKGKFLAIPLPGAKSGVGSGVSPRNYPKGELFPVTSKRGNLILMSKSGPKFVLKRSVKIPKRPTIDPMIARTVDKIANLVADANVSLYVDGRRAV
jgi:phage gpG-like protein